MVDRTEASSSLVVVFALKGDKFDGNQYAEKALASGCVYAVIDNPDYFIGERTILVDNVLTTLQQLAHRHRKVIGCPIIGITGTNGKTTTKEPRGQFRLSVVTFGLCINNSYSSGIVIVFFPL